MPTLLQHFVSGAPVHATPALYLLALITFTQRNSAARDKTRRRNGRKRRRARKILIFTRFIDSVPRRRVGFIVTVTI